MSSRASIIHDRLTQAFSPDHLQVIDESNQHVGHAGHQGGERHFAIIVTADCFKNISKVDAHRKIYHLFMDMMPEQIHALRIIIR